MCEARYLFSYEMMHDFHENAAFAYKLKRQLTRDERDRLKYYRSSLFVPEPTTRFEKPTRNNARVPLPTPTLPLPPSQGFCPTPRVCAVNNLKPRVTFITQIHYVYTYLELL